MDGLLCGGWGSRECPDGQGVHLWLLGKVQVASEEPPKDPPKRMPRQLPPRREVIKDDRRNGERCGARLDERKPGVVCKERTVKEPCEGSPCGQDEGKGKMGGPANPHILARARRVCRRRAVEGTEPPVRALGCIAMPQKK